VNIRGQLSNNLMLCVSAWFGVLFLFSKQQASILGNSRLGGVQVLPLCRWMLVQQQFVEPGRLLTVLELHDNQQSCVRTESCFPHYCLHIQLMVSHVVCVCSCDRTSRLMGTIGSSCQFSTT
jgi:hypothetical protein